MKFADFLIALTVTIFTGLSQQDRQFSYVARICKDNSSLRCSGVLVSRNLVLTSGFCVYEASQVRVYLGTSKDLCSKKYIHDKRTINSSQIFLHKNFRKSKNNYFSNDVAMILLPAPVKLTSTLKTAKLTTLAADKLAGKKAFVIGWGPKTDLQYTDTTVQSQDNCANIFQDKFNKSQHGCSKFDDENDKYLVDPGSPVEYDETIIGYKTTDPFQNIVKEFMFINIYDYLPFINDTMKNHPVPDSGLHLQNSLISLILLQFLSLFIYKLVLS